jgi:sortase A
MRWRPVVRGVGKSLITLGVLILLFVAYQLFGTGLAERQHQHDLRQAFARQLQAPAAAATQPSTATPTTAAGPAPPPTGEAVAIIRIPRIGVDKAVVNGVGVPDLQKGPGHYPNTPLPGQPGNAAIAGHRTTYGAPFFRLDELGPGDPIFVTTRQGKFLYEVTASQKVKPTDVQVIDPTPDNRLTLTTCNPRFSAAQRLVVTASLKGTAADAAPPPPPPAAGPAPAPVTPAAAVDAGLSGEKSARLPAVLWALAAALAAFGAWWLAQRWHRWVTYLLATAPVLVLLFFCFENINRLLPANI